MFESVRQHLIMFEKHISIAFDNVKQCSKALDSIQQCLEAFGDTRQHSVAFDSVRQHSTMSERNSAMLRNARFRYLTEFDNVRLAIYQHFGKPILAIMANVKSSIRFKVSNLREFYYPFHSPRYLKVSFEFYYFSTFRKKVIIWALSPCGIADSVGGGSFADNVQTGLDILRGRCQPIGVRD